MTPDGRVRIRLVTTPATIGALAAQLVDEYGITDAPNLLDIPALLGIAGNADTPISAEQVGRVRAEFRAAADEAQGMT